MASFKRRMSGKAVLFAYDHKQISKRGQRLGDSYREVKRIIENIGKDKTRRKALLGEEPSFGIALYKIQRRC